MEVQRKLNLQKRKLISNGFSENARLFFEHNNAVLEIDSFSDSFDSDDSVSVDNSIARAVLEGYLIFIREAISFQSEIVKHTQQEVGGYLLAKYLTEMHPSIEDLFQYTAFLEKVIGDDPMKHHQLRLDILKFLIAIKPEIIPYLKSKESLSLSWWYLYNCNFSNLEENIPNYLLENANIVELDEVVNSSWRFWFDSNHKFNFHFVAKILEKMDLWTFDNKWTYFIFSETDYFFKFIEEKRNEINTTSLEYDKVVAKFIAFIAATTVRDLRDSATIYLVDFGIKHPYELLELTEYSSSLSDEYIYERLVSCCYGVALIRQNDEDFVQNILPKIAGKLYELQFSENALHPIYNYIVLDSIKHFIELAIYKNVFKLNNLELENLNKYSFPIPYLWSEPTKEQYQMIKSGGEMSWPDPLKMDFALYTIPRLVNDEQISRLDAVANVYNRVKEIGYKSSDFAEFDDKNFRNFYFAQNTHSQVGKIDRLGKKYCWKGFFDYAGYLLQRGELNVYNKFSEQRQYERLSDIDIDISLPNKQFHLNLRLYNQNLINNRDNNSDWYADNHIDSIREYFEHMIEDDVCLMLHGMIDQRINKSYETRSFLLVETFFIKKNENFQNAKEVVGKTISDWKFDNHFVTDHLNGAYFGELYWKEFGVTESGYVSIPTGVIKATRKQLGLQDILQDVAYSHEDIGREIKDSRQEMLQFESEPTLLRYLFETNSKILNGFSEYFPSLKMGKALNLKAEPKTASILDSELKKCFYCIGYDHKYFRNEFNFMKLDLVKKYMKENNLAILYQVKQHSYESGIANNRLMKYFIYD